MTKAPPSELTAARALARQWENDYALHGVHLRVEVRTDRGMPLFDVRLDPEALATVLNALRFREASR